jgi:HEAT repeat protein
MPSASELNRLLSLVSFRPHLNAVDGLVEFRRLLKSEPDAAVLRFLRRAVNNAEGEVRGGLAFVIAEHYFRVGDLGALRRLFAKDDAGVKKSVMNALWDEPPASTPRMGPGILALAMEALRHPAAEVRSEGCSVVQNQCGWVDVSDAVEPLLSLLADPSGLVRMQAACAVGNLAKKKYDVSRHVIALTRNLKHGDYFVREYSAWALWELSRSRHDIGPAVAGLARLLASRDGNNDNPRKNATGALLHHAKKSAENARQVRQCADEANLDGSLKVVRRIMEQLAGA